MHFFIRILISLIVAALAWAAILYVPALPLVAALFGATIVTAVLISLIPPASHASASHSAQPPDTQPISISDKREEGSVKWFNVSKGFGFITKDDGEEIFVHFRSIRGEGHRALRDGQRVSFVEAQTDKGPQAEDVVAL